MNCSAFLPSNQRIITIDVILPQVAIIKRNEMSERDAASVSLPSQIPFARFNSHLSNLTRFSQGTKRFSGQVCSGKTADLNKKKQCRTAARHCGHDAPHVCPNGTPPPPTVISKGILPCVAWLPCRIAFCSNLKGITRIFRTWGKLEIHFSCFNERTSYICHDGGSQAGPIRKNT